MSTKQLNNENFEEKDTRIKVVIRNNDNNKTKIYYSYQLNSVRFDVFFVVFLLFCFVLFLVTLLELH